LVIEDGVNWRILDDRQELLELLVLFQLLEEIDAVHLLGLFEGSEFDVLWWVSLISDWTFSNEVIVVSTH